MGDFTCKWGNPGSYSHIRGHVWNLKKHKTLQMRCDLFHCLTGLLSQLLVSTAWSHREPGQPSIQPQKAGNARKTNICTVALCQFNSEKVPSCKAALDHGSGNPPAVRVVRFSSWSKRRREAACPSILLPIPSSLPAILNPQPFRQSSTWLINLALFFPTKAACVKSSFFPTSSQ